MEDNTRKRKKTRRYYNFHTFGTDGYPIRATGQFRDNVESYIEKCGIEADYEVDGCKIWITLLAYESKRAYAVPLYTVKEDVTKADEHYCDFCNSAGWGDNLVSKWRYHFIIPTAERWNQPFEKGDFKLQTHFLHGLIHSNGSGHLICINGTKDGPVKLYGNDIMYLWDRICANLLARKITVKDVTELHKMELKLIHGIAFGKSWFGNWGYRFCKGSFGVGQYKYEEALRITSSMTLDEIINDNNLVDIKQIIDYYRGLSEATLHTLRDLLCFMLSLKHGKFQNFTTVSNMEGSRWTSNNLEDTAIAIVDALKRNNHVSCVMSREKAIKAVRRSTRDTGLIGHVLKLMDDVIVGNNIVRKVFNKLSKRHEYAIQDATNASQVNLEPGSSINTVHAPPVSHVNLEPGSSISTVHAPPVMPERDVYDDLAVLYNNFLSQNSGSQMLNEAVRTILHSKIFVKEEQGFKVQLDGMLRYKCQLKHLGVIVNAPEDIEKYSIAEYIELLPNATIGDLKKEVKRAFRDTYCVMHQLEIIEELSDNLPLSGNIQAGSEISVMVTGLDLNALKCESGKNNWKVDCPCGARDYDGETMVCCGKCLIRKHKRCTKNERSEEEEEEEKQIVYMCQGCYGFS